MFDPTREKVQHNLARRPKADQGKPPGRDSILWETFSDLATSPFSIPVLVMQAAHPDIGAAVAQYSVYKTEPWGRLFRTGFSFMRFMYDGKNGRQSRDEALSLRALHAHIKGFNEKGERYHAIAPHTFRVVPDTFLDAVIRVRAAQGRPLDEVQKERVFEEYINLCLLFGIPRSALPKDLSSFQREFDHLLLNVMTYNETVAFLLGDMMRFGPEIKYLPLPKSWWQAIYKRTFYPLARIFTIGFLDPRFRVKHKLAWSDEDEKKYRRNVKVVRFCVRFIPRFLRYHPMALYIMLGGHGPKAMTYERLRKHLR